MQLTREQFEHIAPLLPRQRGNVRLDNFEVVNAIVYVAPPCQYDLHHLPPERLVSNER